MAMTKKILRVLVLSFIVLASVATDQVTKQLARGSLKEKGTVHVLGNFLVLHYTENYGAFLGLGSDWPILLRRIIFGALSLALVIGILVYAIRNKHSEIADTVGMALIIGGGIGNMIDRIVRGGSVSDFVNIGIGKVRTGIFNFADVFLIAGVVVIAIIQIKKR
ncbi:MAG: signal peptidase II [Spirochaetales bacterium]|nr:signal peptidase II [Spirochaetales bacterium]